MVSMAASASATPFRGIGAQSALSGFAGMPPEVENVAPNRGPLAGGTEVTITGTNFTGATEVDFGSASASFTVKTGSSLKAIAPPGSGPENVTVTTPEGTSAISSADEFFYGPVIRSVFPNSGPVHGNDTVRINGYNLTGATAVKFGATNATSFEVQSPVLIVAKDPAGTGTVDVTVTTPEGSSPISPADQFTYLGKTPQVSKVTPNKGPAAGGTTVTISGLNFLGTTAVNFGETGAASFTVNSEKSLTAVSPAETVARIEITVTTPYGTSPHEFCAKLEHCSIRDYYKFVTPTITNVSPNSGSTAGGTSVTVTGTGFGVGTGATVFKFGSTPASSVNCTTITSCAIVSPPHKAGVFAVRATVGGMTTAIAPPDEFTFN